jgi:sugar lactone lactonase YvrE
MKTSFRICNLRIVTALMLFTCLGAASSLHAQIINTIAGTGTAGFSGDGAASTTAQLNEPTCVAVDRYGNIYIADNNNNCVRKIRATTGFISTIAGTGVLGFSGDGAAATAAQLAHPTGVAVDSSGNVYIADASNNRIRKIAVGTGFISTIAGTGEAFGFGGDGGAATAAQLFGPEAVAVDGSSNVYIADVQNNRIRKITAATGFINTIAGTGAIGFSGDGGAASAAALANPEGVAVDGSGNVYIVDSYNNRIRKITAATGMINTIAGTTKGFSGDAGAATTAQIFDPLGVTIDGSGNIYITDYGNSRIRKIKAGTGVISTIAGTGTDGYNGDGGAAASAQLNKPGALAVDSSGNVYIPDYDNNRIRKIVGLNNAVQGSALDEIVSGYPNPTTGLFALEISKVRAGATILVTDVAGNIRATKTILQGELPTVTLDLTGFAKGMYLVQVRDGELNYRTKIVVQ